VPCSVIAIRTTTIQIDCIAEITTAESSSGNQADEDLAAAIDALADEVTEALWGSEPWRSGSTRTTVDASLRPYHDVGPVNVETLQTMDGDRRIAGARITIPVQHQIEWGA